MLTVATATPNVSRDAFAGEPVHFVPARAAILTWAGRALVHIYNNSSNISHHSLLIARCATRVRIDSKTLIVRSYVLL